jgi:protein-S-isoprenylcysteine O-methyltransferase Ste14
MSNEAAVGLAPSTYATGSRAALLLDFTERAFVLLMMAAFAIRFNPHIQESVCNLLIMISEGLTGLMILIRRPGPMMNTGYGWAIAIIGTFSPLLIVPGGMDGVPPAAAVLLMTTGLLCSISAKIFLRRSFGIVPANRGIICEGPYRIVRHPIYFGYLLTQIGFLSQSFSLYNVLVYAACWMAMVLRIRAEEEVLSTSLEYRDYRQVVRHRLIPFVW